MDKTFIVATEPVGDFVQVQRATLSCGHVLLLGGDWSLGDERLCEACVRHEPKIVSVAGREKDGRQQLVLYLSCGDIQTLEQDERFPTAAAAQAFVDTTTPCDGPRCREGRQGHG